MKAHTLWAPRCWPVYLNMDSILYNEKTEIIPNLSYNYCQEKVPLTQNISLLKHLSLDKDVPVDRTNQDLVVYIITGTTINYKRNKVTFYRQFITSDECTLSKKPKKKNSSPQTAYYYKLSKFFGNCPCFQWYYWVFIWRICTLTLSALTFGDCIVFFFLNDNNFCY